MCIPLIERTVMELQTTAFDVSYQQITPDDLRNSPHRNRRTRGWL